MDLRVHTTAPSSKKDDEKFKAQAKTYGSFVAASTCVFRTSDGSLATGNELHSPSFLGHNSAADGPNTIDKPYQDSKDAPEAPYDPTTFLEETQLGYTALESQLFVPSSRSRDPRTALSHAVEGHMTTDAHSHDEHPSFDDEEEDRSSSSHQVPSQSSYLHSPVLGRSTKKPRLSEDNRRLFKGHRTLLPPFDPLQNDANPAATGLNRGQDFCPTGVQDHHNAGVSGSNSILGDDVTSELPSSYSLSDMTSGSSKSRHQSLQRSVSDPGPSPKKSVELVEPNRGDKNQSPNSQQLSKSPHCGHQPRKSEHPRKPISPANVQSPNGKSVVKDFVSRECERQNPPISAVETADYAHLPTSIRAPPPQPSLEPFETHITDALKYLGENTGLIERYQPVSVVRELRRSERGHWKFNITPWPAQLQAEFFQFLAKMIEAGRVGWGVWCARQPHTLDVQVFCWGEVLRHVYLMLFVASKSKVRKLGLQWIDSEGKVVVQMRGITEVGNPEKSN